MCRWAAYSGKPLYIEDIIASPCHSLIEQSHAASECKTAINGDGFGLAWYGDHEEPGIYCDILPAWSDRNLRNIARMVDDDTYTAWRDGDRTETHTGREWKRILEDESDKA